MIPYEIKDGFSSRDRAGIAAAVAYMESNTCLKFVPYEGDGRSLPRMSFNAVKGNQSC